MHSRRRPPLTLRHTHLLLLVRLGQHAAQHLARLQVLHYRLCRAPHFEQPHVALALDVGAVGLAVAAPPLGHLRRARRGRRRFFRVLLEPVCHAQRLTARSATHKGGRSCVLPEAGGTRRGREVQHPAAQGAPSRGGRTDSGLWALRAHTALDAHHTGSAPGASSRALLAGARRTQAKTRQGLWVGAPLQVHALERHLDGASC